MSDQKKSDVLALFALVALALVVFWPVLAPNDCLNYFGVVDVSLVFGPYLYFTDYSIHVDHDFPTWNPLVLCGTPFAANPQSLLFYPPNLVRSLLNFYPTPLNTMVSFTVLIWLHVVLMGVGGYFLARTHGIGALASLFGGTALAFSFTPLQASQVNLALLLTATWLPYTLAFLRLSISTMTWANALKFALLGAGTFALTILAGFSPYLPAISLGISTYCAIAFLSRAMERAVAPRPAILRCVMALALVFCVGFLLAAAVLVPTAEMVGFSTRAADSPVKIESRRPGIETGHGPLLVLERLVYYPPVGRGLRPFGAGAGAAMLAVFVTWHARRRDALAPAVLLYFFIDCAIGPPYPIATLLERVAPFQMSNPDYVALLCVVPMSLLVAFGADGLLRFACGANKRRMLFTAVATAVVVGVLLFYAVNEPSTVLATDQMMDTGVAAPMPPAAFVAVACAAILTIAAAGGKYVRTAALLLFCAMFAEQFAASRNLLPYPRERVGSSFALPDAVLAAARQARPAGALASNERFSGAYWNVLMYRLESSAGSFDPLHLISTYRVLAGESFAKGEDHRFVPPGPATHTYPWLKRSFWLARNYVAAPLPPPGRAYPCAETVFLPQESVVTVPRVELGALPESEVSGSITRADLPEPDTASEAKIAGISSYSYMLRMPEQLHSILQLTIESTGPCSIIAEATEKMELHRAHLGRREVETPATASTVAFPLPDWPEMRIDVEIRTEESANGRVVKAELIQDRADEGVNIKLLRRTADVAELEVTCVGDRMLLFTDAGYPGWHVRVDGVEQSILRANDAFKAVSLTPGAHRVEFVFRSARVTMGVAISVMAFGGWLAAIVFLCRIRRPCVAGSA